MWLIADHMDDKKKAPDTSNPKKEIMEIANEVRSAANSMTDERREDSFRHGMQLIYGGKGGVPAKTGRS
jgi:hypothetical protein